MSRSMRVRQQNWPLHKPFKISRDVHHFSETVICEIVDGCGNAIEAPVDIELSLLPSCHYYEEDFEGDFLAAGTEDLAGLDIGAL